MDENLNQRIGAEELKNETKETINQVKENLKNVNVKEEAKATKGFGKEMLKNPLDKINEIANDNSNGLFKTAIVLVIIWTVVATVDFLSLEILFNEWIDLGDRVLMLIKNLLRPICSVFSMAFVLLWLNKKEKKSLITYITTITTVKLPIILAELVSLLTLIDSDISTVTSKVSTFARHISFVLLFFAIKSLSNETDDKRAFKKFVVVEGVWIVLYFVISLLGISMS